MPRMQQVDSSVWIAPGAQRYGRIPIGRHSCVWICAVIRTEHRRVELGPITHLRDFSRIHVGFDPPAHIGFDAELAELV